MLNLKQIKNHPQILEFIKQTETSLEALGYTEHGIRHAELVSSRARIMAEKIGLDKNGQEIAAIAGFCHDMGNFLGRSRHHYWGALLFHQIFQNDFSPKELSWIMQAIVNHDKYTMKLTNPISAIVVIADKSDVSRSRVKIFSLDELKVDIHDRVNYAATSSGLKIDRIKKKIVLTIKIDRKYVPIMEYFEIFTERMAYCRQAADYLGYKFSLVINNFKLL